MSKTFDSNNSFFGFTKRNQENAQEKMPQLKSFDKVQAGLGQVQLSSRSKKLVANYQAPCERRTYTDQVMMTSNQVKAINSEVELPPTYHIFDNFSPRFNFGEKVDFPMFYPKTPMLAHTMIFTRSEVEKLDSTPILFTKFET